MSSSRKGKKNSSRPRPNNHQAPNITQKRDRGASEPQPNDSRQKRLRTSLTQTVDSQFQAGRTPVAQASIPAVLKIDLAKAKCPLPLLICEPKAFYFAAIDMHGGCEFFHKGRREGIASYSLSIFEDSSNCEVNATCVTKDLGIIGLHAKGPSRTAGRQAQLAILPLASEGVKPKCYDPMRDPHLVSKSVNNERKGGITALAGVDYDNSLKFLSSGSDKHTYLWTIYPHTHRYTASTERLSFQTRAIVQALGFERGSGTVLSADGKRILSLDLSSNAVRKNVTMAHNVYNIHTGQSPYVVLLETESVDAQIQMYDLRSGNFDRPPVVAFGQDLPSYVPDKMKVLSPSARGSLSPNKQLFARGFNDGGVQVWDLRKHTVATKTYDHRLHSGSIFHTAFISESELVARENDALWFIDTKRA